MTGLVKQRLPLTSDTVVFIGDDEGLVGRPAKGVSYDVSVTDGTST